MKQAFLTLCLSIVCAAPIASANQAHPTPTGSPTAHDPKAQYNADRDQSDARVYRNDAQGNLNNRGVTKPANSDTELGTRTREATGADSGAAPGSALSRGNSEGTYQQR